MRRPPSSDYRHLRLRLAASLTKAGKYKPATPWTQPWQGDASRPAHLRPGRRWPGRATRNWLGAVRSRRSTAHRFPVCHVRLQHVRVIPGLSLPCQVSHTLFSHVSGLIGVLACLPVRQSGRIPCHFADSTSARRFCCAALPPGVVHFCDVTCCNVRVTNVKTPGPGWQEGLAP